MNLKLAGQLALITGGSKGIGLACARTLLEEGMRVVISARTQVGLLRATDSLGHGVAALAGDLVDPEAALAVVNRCEVEYGPVDLLVNCAGAARHSPPDALTPAHWRDAMDAKFFSYINVIDPLIKRMADRGRGVVINVIGNGGKLASPQHLAGGSANAALMLATVGLGAAYGPRGVRVVGINPGLVATDRATEAFAVDAAANNRIVDAAQLERIARIPLGRMAEPEEVAAAVAFLASSLAESITGVNITMDGALGAMIV